MLNFSRTVVAAAATAAVLALAPGVAIANGLPGPGPQSPVPGPGWFFADTYQGQSQCLYWENIAVTVGQNDAAWCIETWMSGWYDLWILPRGANDPGGPL